MCSTALLRNVVRWGVGAFAWKDQDSHPTAELVHRPTDCQAEGSDSKQAGTLNGQERKISRRVGARVNVGAVW